MSNPKGPDDPPITCCDLGDGSIFGWELLDRERPAPCARFTAIAVPTQTSCLVTLYSNVEYIALLARAHPGLAIQQFVEERERWFTKAVISKRDTLANKKSSGQRRISLFAPPKSPSSPGMRIPLPPAWRVDYDELPETPVEGMKSESATEDATKAKKLG